MYEIGRDDKFICFSANKSDTIEVIKGRALNHAKVKVIPVHPKSLNPFLNLDKVAELVARKEDKV